MSRKLPCCAFCGETLVRRGRILFEFEGNIGSPAIGWHSHPRPSCASKDVALFEQTVEDYKNDDRNGIPESILAVFKRDTVRVSLTRDRDLFEAQVEK